MAQEVDIFNPQVSVIAHGLEGKTILLYGTNNVGKTNQAVRANKPFVLACENGLNGIAGVKYSTINNWSSFRKAIKQLTSKSTIEKSKKHYQTIIIDEVYASSMYCQDFICQTYGNGAIDLGDDTGNTRLNLYRLYEKEYWREINKLVNSGYTTIFIAHEELKKDGMIYPKGDEKRALSPIINNCDIVAYIHPNGVDEDGKEIKSSAYFVQTDKFFARSRYPYMVEMIEEFTIENLSNAIDKAIADQAEAEGLTTVSYEEQKEMNTVETKSYEELMDIMQKYGELIAENGYIEDLTSIVEENLGQGRKAADLKKGQEQIIEILIGEFEDFCQEKGLK